jgi:hypothetical protein
MATLASSRKARRHEPSHFRRPPNRASVTVFLAVNFIATALVRGLILEYFLDLKAE